MELNFEQLKKMQVIMEAMNESIIDEETQELYENCKKAITQSTDEYIKSLLITLEAIEDKGTRVILSSYILHEGQRVSDNVENLIDNIEED